MTSAAVPTMVDNIHGDDRWMCLHNRFISETKEKEPDVVFFGDSIVQGLGQTDMWNTMFEPMHSLNFGIGGENTSQLLWRLQNGELECFKPKIIVLHIGTNNHGHTAQQIMEGIEVILKLISEKQPQAFIVVLTLLPRGQFPNPLREKIEEVNQLLVTQIQHIPKTQLLKIDSGFIQSDGTISHHDMFDYLHLTQQGYRKAFEPVYELLQQLMAE